MLENFEPYVLQFIQKVIPDAHICAHDYLNFQTCFLSPTNMTKVLHAFQATCLQFSSTGLHCHFLAQFTSQNIKLTFQLLSPYPSTLTTRTTHALQNSY